MTGDDGEIVYVPNVYVPCLASNFGGAPQKSLVNLRKRRNPRVIKFHGRLGCGFISL